LRLLYYAQSAFTIWMMVDCYRRGGPGYWYMLLWMPFGPIAYFFAVKIHDFDLRPLRHLIGLDRPPSLQSLRYALRETDSGANRLMLAQALVDANHSPEEAETLLRAVLKRDPDDKRALYALARAQLQRADRTGALATLDELAERDPVFADGQAMRMRVDLLWDEGHRDEAVADLEKLCQRSGRLEFRVGLAEYLGAVGRAVEGSRLLDQALEEYRHAPWFIQRRDARARRQGSALRKLLATHVSPVDLRASG
jgi:hypothetical protein